MNRFFFGKRGEIATMITILTIGIVSMLGVLISKVNNSTVSTSSKAQQAYPQCIDTDKGPYFSKAGKVTYKTVDTNGTVQTFEYKDKCVKGNGLPGTGVPAFDTVTEYYCDGTTLKNKELPCRDVARGDSCVTDTETIGYCNGETVPKPTSPMDAPIPTGGFSGEARIDSIRTRYLSKSTATFDVVYCGGNQPWPTIYGETWIDGEMVTTVHRTPVQFNRAGGDEACKKVQVTVDFAKAYQDDPCQDILLVGKGKYDQARNDASFKQVANFPFLVTKNPECILPTATPTQTPTATPMPDATATPVPPAVCTYDADSYICTDLKDGVCDTTKLVKEDGFKNEFLKADGQPNTLTMKDGQTSVHYPTANLTKEYNSYVKLIPPTSDWEITSTYCTKDGTGVCPANAGQPVDKLDSFKVACGAKYNYGWVIKKKSVQTNKTYQLDLYDSTRPDGTDDRTCWAVADTKDGTNNNIRTADFSNYACSGAVDGKVNKLTASYTNKTSGTVKVRWQINSCDGTLGENDNKCEKNPISASPDFLIDVPAGKKLTCDWKNPNTIKSIDKDADCTITDAGSVSPPASTNTPTPTRTPTPTPTTGSGNPPAATATPTLTPTPTTGNTSVCTTITNVQVKRLDGTAITSSTPLSPGDEFKCIIDSSLPNSICAIKLNDEWPFYGTETANNQNPGPNVSRTTNVSTFTLKVFDKVFMDWKFKDRNFQAYNFKVVAFDNDAPEGSACRVPKGVMKDFYVDSSKYANTNTGQGTGGTSQILTDRTLAVKIDLNDDRSVNIVDYLQATTAMRNNNGTYVKKDGSVVQVNALVISSMIENLGKIVQ